MGNGFVHDGTIHISMQIRLLVMDGELGKPYPLYFFGKFDSLPLSYGVWDKEELLPNKALLKKMRTTDWCLLSF